MINFFNVACQESPRTDKEFGILDGRPLAYTSASNPTSWIATVKNQSSKQVVFTAIDACVITGEELKGVKRCDGMLTTDDTLFLVELKDQQKNWQSAAIRQLIDTIEILLQNHDVSGYRHKKAFACNRAHQRFQEIDHELNLEIFRKFRFRIDAQATIIVL
ncbi:hypothetical protein [Algoriphagus namhaensis]